MRQGRKEAAVMAARIFVAVASGSRSCITLNCYRRKGRKSIYHIVPLLNTLQMRGKWESNINVWIPYMYSQKWNCAALLFPKQNFNVLSPDSYIRISVRDLYISRIGLSILLQPNMWTESWEYKNHSQTYENRNWDWGCAIQKLDFRYSVGAVAPGIGLVLL